MRKLVGVSALLAAAVCLPAPAGAQEKKTGGKAAEAKLEGTYTVVSGEENGRAVPADRVKGSAVVFTGDTITGTDKDKKEFFAAKYTLDTGKTPWAIRMRSTAPKEADAVGLIKKEGDTLTLIYAKPGAAAPTEFKTKDGQNMFVLRSATATEKGKK
jgi:uncharacterized protein (TIGR03067 family)